MSGSIIPNRRQAARCARQPPERRQAAGKREDKQIAKREVQEKVLLR
jgi:hypothetical protein